MIIELGLVAVAAALGGWLTARTLSRRRPSALPPTPPLLEAPSAQPERDDLAALPARVGYVIQVGDHTRWPQQAIVMRADGELVCAVLLGEEDGAQQATVAMAPPDRHLYWLEEVPMALPASPPARLEVGGSLLDRVRLLTVELERVGEACPEVGDVGRFALYQGTLGDAAVVLQAGLERVWYGQRVEPGEYDCLGRGDGDEA